MNSLCCARRAVELLDPNTRDPLCALYPLDKAANADGQRRRLDPQVSSKASATPAPGDPMPPLLRKLLAEFAATGKPPAYLPKHDGSQETP